MNFVGQGLSNNLQNRMILIITLKWTKAKQRFVTLTIGIMANGLTQLEDPVF